MKKESGLIGIAWNEERVAFGVQNLDENLKLNIGGNFVENQV